MEQFLDRFAKVPGYQKLLVMVLVLGVIGAMYWNFWYSEAEDQLLALDSQISELARKKAEMEKVRADVRKYEKEVERLEEDKKELENQLPQDKAVAALVESFENEAKLIGVTLDGINPESEILGDLYAEIPVELRMTGSYHGILKFFDRVGRLPRIVNVGSIELRDPKVSDGGVTLTATCTATTFRYLKPEERPRPVAPKPTGPPPAPKKPAAEEEAG